MSKSRPTISEQLRAAIEGCGLSRYELCRRCGLAESQLSRFVHGAHLTTASVDRLCDELGLTLTGAGQPKRSKRSN